MQSATLHLREQAQGEATWPLLTPPLLIWLPSSPLSVPPALVPLFSSIFSSHTDCFIWCELKLTENTKVLPLLVNLKLCFFHCGFWSFSLREIHGYACSGFRLMAWGICIIPFNWQGAETVLHFIVQLLHLNIPAHSQYSVLPVICNPKTIEKIWNLLSVLNMSFFWLLFRKTTWLRLEPKAQDWLIKVSFRDCLSFLPDNVFLNKHHHSVVYTVPTAYVIQ